MALSRFFSSLPSHLFLSLSPSLYLSTNFFLHKLANSRCEFPIFFLFLVFLTFYIHFSFLLLITLLDFIPFNLLTPFSLFLPLPYWRVMLNLTTFHISVIVDLYIPFFYLTFFFSPKAVLLLTFPLPCSSLNLLPNFMWY